MCTVLKCYQGYEGHLGGNEEDDYIEDSDYESEPESTRGPLSQSTKVNSERKLVPVLNVGSSVA